jgi:hypothetical protein
MKEENKLAMVVYFGLLGFFSLISAFGFQVVDDLKQGQRNQGGYIAPGPVVWMHSTWPSLT